jgi:riboflavin kinase, archaea type
MIELVGAVSKGQGYGVERMAPGVISLLHARTGVEVIPGTLNVRLHQPADESLFPNYLPASDLAHDWAETTGQTGYRWAHVTIEGRFDGVAVRAEEPDYPENLIEIICGVHLRSTLGLKDGDEVKVTVL